MSDSAKGRYLVLFAYVPDEAFWCTFQDYSAVCKKVAHLWGVKDPAFRCFLPVGACPGKSAVVVLSSEIDFAMWYPKEAAKPLSDRVVVHDRTRNVSVQRASEPYILQRPLLDYDTLCGMGAAFSIRNITMNEMVLVSAEEVLCWGTAIEKVQRAWGIRSPLLRYIDDASGERVMVAIVDKEDFIMWQKHRLPAFPELSVFEMDDATLMSTPAAPQQVDTKTVVVAKEAFPTNPLSAQALADSDAVQHSPCKAISGVRAADDAHAVAVVSVEELRMKELIEVLAKAHNKGKTPAE